MRYTIIGAGKGGHAMAAHLKSMGAEVCLWNRPGKKISDLMRHPEITATGVLEGKFPLDLATDNLEEAIAFGEIISVMAVANQYRDIAENITPYLQDGQGILLNAGGFGASLLFYQILKQKGNPPSVSIGDTNTSLYVSTLPGPRISAVEAIKKELDFTEVSSNGCTSVYARVKGHFPQFIRHLDPLYPGIKDAGIFHTAGMVLNQDRVKRKDKFQFYIEGVTPEIGRFMEAMDVERLKVMEALGLPAITINEWLNQAYGIQMGPLDEMIHNNPSYHKCGFAPTTFDHRFLTEEVPAKLVPRLEIARILNVPQDKTQRIVDEACNLVGRDLRADARTLEKLGFIEDDILGYSKHGIRPYLLRHDLHIQ